MKQKNRKLTKQMHGDNYITKYVNVNKMAAGLSTLIILIFFIYALLYKQEAYNQILALQNAILIGFKPIFMWTVVLIFFMSIVLIFSKVSNVRLGGANARPQFSRFSWYSMLFSAGMGIGIMFYGVAEPILHYGNTPLFGMGNDIDSALATSYFHWGVQAWAIYGIIALGLAFYSFNLKLPLAPRSLLYPLLKDGIYSTVGDVVDGICIVTTLLALSSSLGLGAMQVNSGFNYLFGLEISSFNQIIIIIFVTLLAILSVVSGLTKGVRILSELNVTLMIVLFLSFFLLGPTLQIIKHLVSSILLYSGFFVQESMSLLSYDATWINDWTIFYWAWWISWSIFVAMFIAKISYGRTIREFILSVILVPSLITILWFGCMGVSGLVGNDISGGVLATMINQDVSIALYATIEYLFTNPFISFILQFISVVLVISFFVTSSDSGSLVVNDLASSNAPKTSKLQKAFWTSLQGIISIILIVLGGAMALDFIQMILLISAVPVSIIVIIVLITLPFKLRVEHQLNEDELS